MKASFSQLPCAVSNQHRRRHAGQYHKISPLQHLSFLRLAEVIGTFSDMGKRVPAPVAKVLWPASIAAFAQGTEN
jgi:hypothetical protein